MGAPELAPLEIRPQEGPQLSFLQSSADVAIYGGSAFSAKTYALLMEDLRHVHDSHFRSVTFRRTTNQIRTPGGLWDEATRMYSAFGVRALSTTLEMIFPSGAVSKFWHLEEEKDVYAWDGAQIPLVKFDQLEHFTRQQFFYMLSRNRDPSGHLKPYCRATCNPEPDSWLADFVSWWIDTRETIDGERNPHYGYPIWERSGIIRWLHRSGDDLYWADSEEEIYEKFGKHDLPRDHPDQPRPLSITFIPGRIYDNKIGLDRDPGYIAKLKALGRVERERLLGHPEWGGNWKIKAAAGLMFQRHWCETLEAEPEDVEWVRGWDLAATRPSESNADPDWTVGVRLGKYRGKNRFVIAPNVVRDRTGPAGVERMMENIAQADGKHVEIRVPQDPGQAGKAQAAQIVARLAGYTVRAHPVTGDKITRFSPFSAQAEAGNVDLVRGVSESFLAQLEGFPDLVHDDDADAVSTAFEKFVIHKGGGNLLEFYRRNLPAAPLPNTTGAASTSGATNTADSMPTTATPAPVVPINGGLGVRQHNVAPWHED